MATFNLARMTTATVGNGATLTLGSAVSGFLTFALAGVADQAIVPYGIIDGANSEAGWGVYTAAGTTLTRNVTKSTAADARISLSGSAQVGISARAEDIELPQLNILLNGAMEISQERLGNALAAAPSLSYIVDGIQILDVGAQVATIQQVADAPLGFVYSAKATITTANAAPATTDVFAFRFPIEGYYGMRLKFGAAGAQSVAPGFWVKANRIGAYSGSITNNTGRSYPFNFSIFVSGVWEYKMIVIPGDVTGTWLTTNGLWGYISIAMMAGTAVVAAAGSWAASTVWGATGTINGVAATTDYMQIAGASFIPGSMPISQAQSPFVMPRFNAALADCQRYYEKSFDYAVVPATNVDASFAQASAIALVQVAGATTNRGISPFKVRKRLAPTMTAFNAAAANAQARNLNTSADVTATAISSTEQGLIYSFTGDTGGAISHRVAVHWTADARL